MKLRAVLAVFCFLAVFTSAGCASGVAPRSEIWRGFPAKVLESERMRAVILPDYGGAIVSIYDKRNKKEWFWHSAEARRNTAIQQEQQRYIMAGGWEDIFPSVGPCEIEVEGRGKVVIPDHGELWNRPWKAEMLHNGVKLSIKGNVFDYTLERICRLSGNTLYMDYVLTNTGDSTFPFVYAGHPVLAVEGKAHILIAPRAKTFVYFSAGNRLGKPGNRFPWPFYNETGKQIDASLVDSSEKGKTDKLFINDIEKGEAGLEDAEGRRLMIRFHHDELPVVGVWTNMNAYPPENPVSVVAIEPTTSAAETLAEAIAAGSDVEIPAGKTLKWSISLSVE